ncbi:P27 family phage terminase small subunit [Faecalicatena faecalis]
MRKGVVYMAKATDNRSGDVKRITRTKKYKEIEADLRDQLEANGTFGKFFEDMIDDYMAMYVTKTLLIEDIQKRGTIVPYNNGGGQSGFKKNEAVDMFNKTNAQMLKLLSELGLKASAAIGGGEYGDEL